MQNIFCLLSDTLIHTHKRPAWFFLVNFPNSTTWLCCSNLLGCASQQVPLHHHWYHAIAMLFTVTLKPHPNGQTMPLKVHVSLNPLNVDACGDTEGLVWFGHVPKGTFLICRPDTTLSSYQLGSARLVATAVLPSFLPCFPGALPASLPACHRLTTVPSQTLHKTAL